MDYKHPLNPGFLIKRYKRFFVDVKTATGEVLTLHCPNTGALSGCLTEGAPVFFTLHQDSKKKLPGTLELVQQILAGKAYWVGVNTMRANGLAQSVLSEAVLPFCEGYQSLSSEVYVPPELGIKSRIDFLMSADTTELDQSHKAVAHSPPMYVEVKSVTFAKPGGLGFFPDAPTARGVKHLKTLCALRRLGYRAVLLFCVQHEGINQVRVADWVDPKYHQQMLLALDAGVEVYGFKVKLDTNRQLFDSEIPFYSA